MFAVCVIAAGIFWTPAFAAAPKALKLAYVYDINQPHHKWMAWAAEEINKRSNGRYDVKVYPGGSLGGESALVEALTLGTIDMMAAGFLGTAYKPIEITTAPFMFRDTDHYNKMYKSPVWEELKKEYTDKTGLHIVASWAYGVRNLTSNKPVSSPKDMVGMKIRVPNTPVYTMFPRAMGASPTPMNLSEVYLALQNGTVDAQENPLGVIKAFKFHEVQKYINVTMHTYATTHAIIGAKLWKDLPDADKKLFTDVFLEAADKITVDVWKEEGELLDWFRAQGTLINEDVDVAAMRAAAKELISNTDMWSKELFEKVQAIQ
jgi:tripartite ATP-independent transporter DctP family solute receptor